MKMSADIATHEMMKGAEDAAAVMRALSNPSRLLILCYLVDGERTVSEIEAAMDLGQAYVSQQLARLRDEGIVSATRDGRKMRYRLSDPRVVPVISVLCEQFGAEAGHGARKAL